MRFFQSSFFASSIEKQPFAHAKVSTIPNDYYPVSFSINTDAEHSNSSPNIVIYFEPSKVKLFRDSLAKSLEDLDNYLNPPTNFTIQQASSEESCYDEGYVVCPACGGDARQCPC
jgi:hypothetical protein